MGFSSTVAAVLSLAVLVEASGVEEGQSEHAAHELVTRYGYLNTTNSWTGSKKIILESSDGEVFEVEESVAVQSQTIKRMIEADNIVIIPIQNVTGKILSKVIEYCKHHLNSGECDLEAFDANFVKVDHDTLFELILAANYLDIKSLLDLTGQTLGEMIKGKSVEEIRKMFNITNDYTPQAEEEVRREKKWALQ